MLIGQLSKRAGLTRDTIRYYEKLGLLVSENRNAENDYKNYGRQALHRLEHIQQLKALGFTLREIRGLLAGAGPMHPCRALPAQLAKKLEAIDKQVATLQQLKLRFLSCEALATSHARPRTGCPRASPRHNRRRWRAGAVEPSVRMCRAGAFRSMSAASIKVAGRIGLSRKSHNQERNNAHHRRGKRRHLGVNSQACHRHRANSDADNRYCTTRNTDNADGPSDATSSHRTDSFVV